MATSVVVVTASTAVRDSVERVLMRARTSVHHEVSAAAGASAAKATGSILICTVDVDWRELVSLLNANGEIGPPVILLVPSADPKLWAEALLTGVFDAIAMNVAPESLIDCVDKAHSRWERAQLVRDALKQNGNLHTAA